MLIIAVIISEAFSICLVFASMRLFVVLKTESYPSNACISPIRHKAEDLTLGSASDNFLLKDVCNASDIAKIVDLSDKFLRKYFSMIFMARTFRSGFFSSIADL